MNVKGILSALKLRRVRTRWNCTVYERNGDFFIHSSSEVPGGPWVINRHVELISGGGSVEDLGKAIRRALEASFQNAPQPASTKDLFDPVLKLSGTRSVSAFSKSAKCVMAETTDLLTVSFTSMRNEAPKKGFSYLEDVSRADFRLDADLGAALLSAMAKSLR